MEVLWTIGIIIIVLLVALFIFAPSLAMIWGMGWSSKKWFPHRSGWMRWGGLLAVLCIIPQVLNVFIERDVTKLVSQSHGEMPRDTSVRILAVESHNSYPTAGKNCNKDCVLLLLSGKIEQYLVVQRPSEHAHPNVTAFSFEKNDDCSYLNEFAGRSLSARLENTVRELSLSGTCLTARETTVDQADVLISYDKIQDPSWLQSSFKGQQISVSQKDQHSGEWVEIYEDVGIRYGQVFPILLPVFTLNKNGKSIDVMRRTKFRTQHKKSVCRLDLFSDFEYCHEHLREKPASEILGISVSEYGLEKSGIIAKKSDRTATLSKLVKTIVLEDREPSLNEWALINRYVSREYYEDESYARLVIDVMAHENFPVPGIYSGVNKFSEDQKGLLATALINRMGNDMPGPEIGSYDQKQQWYNLYNVLKKLPVETVEPYFDDLVNAASKRSNKKIYVGFFEKFGSRSREPILELIETDKKRLKYLSSVMCKLGPELSGIEEPLMEMAQKREIKLGGNYGQTVYLLLDLGVDEDRILNTVGPSDWQASTQINSIKRSIEKYKAGKARCR